MKPRILIVSASVGTGHTRAAEAIQAALSIRHPSIESHHIDALEFTHPVFARAYRRSYLEIVNRNPALWGYLYSRTSEMQALRKAERVIAFLDRFNTRAFRKRVADLSPRHVVCTHFLPGEVIARQNKRAKVKTPFSIVVTDFDVHPFWLVDGTDTYLVGNEEVAWRIRETGFRKDGVLVTGIPIHPDFSKPSSRAGARRRLGLDPKRPTVLVLSGGYGVGDMMAAVKAVCRIGRRLQVIAIAGRNRALERKLRATKPPRGTRLLPFGFTTEMPTMMDAADLLVGKSGGLVSSEALAKALPMVILAPTPGQEERNCDHLLEMGAAVRVAGIPSLSFKLGKLLQQPKQINHMRSKSRLAGRPSAAFTVSKFLWDKVKKSLAPS